MEELGEDGKKVLTSSDKRNKLWGCKVQPAGLQDCGGYLKVAKRGFFLLLLLFFVFVPFLGPLPRHMEVPRLGV